MSSPFDSLLSGHDNKTSLFRTLGKNEQQRMKLFCKCLDIMEFNKQTSEGREGEMISKHRHAYGEMEANGVNISINCNHEVIFYTENSAKINLNGHFVYEWFFFPLRN